MRSSSYPDKAIRLNHILLPAALLLRRRPLQGWSLTPLTRLPHISAALLLVRRLIVRSSVYLSLAPTTLSCMAHHLQALPSLTPALLEALCHPVPQRSPQTQMGLRALPIRPDPIEALGVTAHFNRHLAPQSHSIRIAHTRVINSFPKATHVPPCFTDQTRNRRWQRLPCCQHNQVSMVSPSTRSVVLLRLLQYTQARVIGAVVTSQEWKPMVPLR